MENCTLNTEIHGIPLHREVLESSAAMKRANDSVPDDELARAPEDAAVSSKRYRPDALISTSRYADDLPTFSKTFFLVELRSFSRSGYSPPWNSLNLLLPPVSQPWSKVMLV